ncbi:MAG: autotransporter-associated beta strand repeat-containing protein, partial [bacterium]
MRRSNWMIVMACVVALRAEAVPTLWLGNTDANWNTAANWTNGIPTSTKAVFFDSAGSSGTTLSNNLAAATQILGMAFTANAPAYTINGNSITLSGNITNNSANLQTINLNAVMNVQRTISLTAGGGDLALNGNLSGVGSLPIYGSGATLTLGGSNSYSGNTTVGDHVTVRLANANAGGASTFVSAMGNGYISTLVFASDTPVNPFPVSYSGAGYSVGGTSTITLDRATPGAAVNGTFSSWTSNYREEYIINAGPNVTSGTPKLTVTGLTSYGTYNSAGHMTLTPTNVDVVLNTVTPVIRATGTSSYQDLILGGSSTGNKILGEMADNVTNHLQLTKQDSGTWTLSGTNSYTGTTTINGGVLRLENDYAVPGGIGLSGGSNVVTFASPGGVLGLGVGDFSRSIGAGTTNVHFNTTASGGFAAYSADRTVNLGGAGATLTWNATDFVKTGYRLIFGASSSTHTVDFQNPLALGGVLRMIQVDDGAAAVDAILSGALTGTAGGGLVKVGDGTLALTGTNTYPGGTTVSNGVLLVNGSITGAVTVVSGSTLGGIGVVAGVVTNLAQGIITAAATNSIGTLTVTNLVMAENSTYVWNYSDTAQDLINVKVALTLPTVATVMVSPISGT